MSYLYYQNGFGIRNDDEDESYERYLDELFQEAQDWYDGATGYSKDDYRRDDCMDRYHEARKQAVEELKKAVENGWVSENYVPTIY